MRHIRTILLGLIGLAFATGASAQMKDKVTDTLKTPTVQCEMCKKRIEDYMSHEDGITKINVDWRKKITIVTYQTSRTNIENIKTAIANVGYDAGDVTANPDSYKALPLCCKKPEDGGGMPKRQ
ncbi:heavy-metal-associated domain-containing protein [Dinghuibacter silviterrae]|nr:cation transporter [Dinghuibacter silviterrae]